MSANIDLTAREAEDRKGWNEDAGKVRSQLLEILDGERKTGDLEVSAVYRCASSVGMLLDRLEAAERERDEALAAAYGSAQVLTEQDRADLDIGRRWRANSSLEEWFPFTAEELESHKRMLAALPALLRGHIAAAVNVLRAQDDGQVADGQTSADGTVKDSMTVARNAQPFAYVARAETGGGVIIWSRNRAAVEAAADQYGRPVDQVYLAPGQFGQSEEIARFAERYQFLRNRDLDTIRRGGVFAGMTPDNVVLNGNDLDDAIDAARAQQDGGVQS